MGKIYTQSYCNKGNKIFKRIDKLNKQYQSRGWKILGDGNIVPCMYYWIEDKTNAIIHQSKKLSDIVWEMKHSINCTA